ncbi:MULTISPECIES: flagellar biosynthesis anti-sigma factor FlgM [unclassified Serratia (in: enterobacteria)]|uniref:flagellar biosynthesis anti-sigma factor FlgM n=1 Tax=unclassified Serratia (in: enterobacteria) TaxID=2647522 RepID=UPI001E5C3A1B|nr:MULTISPECIES: flagellar biosynthesis anti-sigma factor FlgM [unclassified Serratia (in: enterobacteria)]
MVKPSSAIDPALGEAQSQLSRLPDVDTERIAEMKDAIKAGKLNIDLDELTSAIQQYYQR